MPRTATKKSTSAAKGAKGATAAPPAQAAVHVPAGLAMISPVVQDLRAITDPTRFRILLNLHAGARNVGEMAVELGGEITQPALSHHLALLRLRRFH